MYWLLDAIHRCTCVQMTHQLQAHGQHMKEINYFFIKKEQKQFFKKRFIKRNLANVGMSQCMNTLADKVHKQEPLLLR